MFNQKQKKKEVNQMEQNSNDFIETKRNPQKLIYIISGTKKSVFSPLVSLIV